jgi:hypothetical protein
MRAPPRALKVLNKDRLFYIDGFDRTKWYLSELIRAALRDVGKLLIYRIRYEVAKMPGMKRSRRKITGIQFWNRKKSQDLQIGAKHGTWYAEDQELGTEGQPKRGIIRNVTFSSIADIRKIEGTYLSAIEDENRALALIDEEEEGGDDGE